MFVDAKTVIPGITNKCISVQNLPPKDVTITTADSMIVHVKNIEVHISKTFEQNIMSFASRYRAHKSAGMF